MQSDFSRILTLLRKEHKISQKCAAMELGISQALLSHYENGIRECGLDFVVKAADYYGVSCDYLLGRIPDPGIAPKPPGGDKTDTAPSQETSGEESGRHETLLGAIRTLLRITDRIGNRRLSEYVEGFFASGVYRMFRRIYQTYPGNESGLFSVPEPRAEAAARCSMEQAAAETEIIVKDSCGEKLMTSEERERGILTTERLVGEYGEDGGAILTLIRNEEESFSEPDRRYRRAKK